MKRAALYIRVSTDEQAKHGLSLDEQKHDLEEYAKRYGYLIYDYYVDDGVSARKSFSKRKELQRLLDDVRADRIDVILFIKLDRWFRNIAGYYKVQEILDKYKVDWIAIHEDYNTNTSAGRLNLNIRLSIAQNESDQTSDRIKYVFEGKKRRREALTTFKIPFGYKVDENKHLVLDEKNAPIMRDLFQYYILHQSIGRTAQYAREKYHLSWCYTTMQRCLHKEAYIGTFYGIKNYMPPLIDEETYITVQKLIKEAYRRVDAPRSTPNRIYLFSGLIHCPECGHMLLATRGNLNPRTKTYTYYKYRCGNHRANNGVCSFSGAIFQAPLEKYLLEHLQDLLAGYAVEIHQKRKSSKAADIEKDIKKAEKSLERLKELYVSGYIDRPTFDSDYQKYNKQLQTAISKRPLEHNVMPSHIKAIMNMDWRSMYDKLSDQGKKDFWHAIIYRIDITGYEPKHNGRKTFKVTFL